ncbi:HAF repeat-containing protein [Aquisphaera insulae]|uniref:HAF repeat-containing protein n=1 Tax=Aquisphaera insulae TaxID=2712864 RepID=UPI00196A53A4|nr:HAF repeat-containing protein [Aquisphaera insulae]
MRISRCLGALAIALISATARADEPARRLQVVLARSDGLIAAGINGKGDTTGFLWVESKEFPGVLDQSPFHCAGGKVTTIPKLQGYTAVFPYALSDDGTVVGRVSKPITPERFTPMSNQAFAWDAAGGIRGLGALAEDTASFATDISRDGRRIAGFSIGNNRVRACYWDRQPGGWKAKRLPGRGMLGSNLVSLSDDGKSVAAVDDGKFCLWTQQSENEWKQELLGSSTLLIPRGVNDSGLIVGVRFTPDGNVHAVCWSRDGGVRLLDGLEGYTRSEANAVNNRGLIVGMLDGPHGSKIDPRACAWEAGKARIIDEAGPDFSNATAINDRDQVTGVLDVEEDEEPKPGAEAKPAPEKSDAPPRPGSQQRPQAPAGGPVNPPTPKGR